MRDCTSSLWAIEVLAVYYLGIDPGQKGGAILIDVNGAIVSSARFDGALSPVRSIAACVGGRNVAVYLERVGAGPMQGVVSMFNFGVEYGKIQGYFETIGTAFTLVPPQTWQRILPAETEGQPAKDRVRAWVASMMPLSTFIFPGCRTPHGGVMDALGIAECGRRVQLGLVPAPLDREARKKRRALKL